MKILIVSHYFPGSRSVIYVWLRPLVEAFAGLGNECVVLCPYSIVFRRRICRRKKIIRLPGCPEITILRPGYLLTRNRQKVMAGGLRKLGFVPDCVYGKFWKGAYLGYDYAKENHIPLFVDCGESSIADKFSKGADCDDFCNYVSGVICVSTKSRDECVSLGLAKKDKCLIAVNGVNPDDFHIMDKEECRRKLGISMNDFVVVSVGLFDERKGISRVAEALDKIADDDVSALFIGSGPVEPRCRNIRHCGPLEHDVVPLYLNASDVFVLPSLAEGCSNAIVEAMACGLPVISSDLPFNKDILDSENALFVNPLDIDEIAGAIRMLKENPEKRDMMGAASLARARELTISDRAKRICDFIESRMGL